MKNRVITGFLVLFGFGMVLGGCDAQNTGAPAPGTTHYTETNTTSTSSDSTELTSQLVIDTSNSEAVGATIFESSDLTVPFLTSEYSDITTAVAKPLEKIAMKYKKSMSSKSNMIGESGSDGCTGGGSMSYTDDGSYRVVTYSGCKESDYTVNGKIALSYDYTVGDHNYTFTNYSITGDFGYYKVSSATLTLTSTVFEYTATGTSSIDGDTAEFNNYSYKMTGISSASMSLSINGTVKRGCLGKWVTITTTSPILMNSSYSCPIDGDITVAGNGTSLKMIFNTDMTISLYLDNVIIQEYENCDEIPIYTGICS